MARTPSAACSPPDARTGPGAGRRQRELVVAAIETGARRVLLSLGGSATTDGGPGAVDVLTPYGPLDGRVGRPEMLVACDVRTAFVDAAGVFGPQKGATSDQVDELWGCLVRLAGQ